MDTLNRQQSVEAFEAELFPVLKLAYGTAYHMTHSREDAEDLVQEASLRAFKAFSTYQAGTNFKAWFFTILVNLIRRRHADQQREPQPVSLPEDISLYLYAQTRKAGFHSGCKDPAAVFLERLDTTLIHEAIENLQEEYKIVSTLYFMGDFSYEEIAEMADCPVGTVRSRLHRSRKMLQKSLWQKAEELGLTAPRKTKKA